MDDWDHYEYHRANAEGFHDRAQVARKESKRQKEARNFVASLKADIRAREYRRSRDEHKALARKYRKLCK